MLLTQAGNHLIVKPCKPWNCFFPVQQLCPLPSQVTGEITAHHPRTFVNQLSVLLIYCSCSPHTSNCPPLPRYLSASPEMRKLKCVLWTLATMRSQSGTSRTQRWGRASCWHHVTLFMFIYVQGAHKRKTKRKADEGRLETERLEESVWRWEWGGSSGTGLGVLYVQINGVVCYLSLAAPADFWPPAGDLPPPGAEREGNWCLCVRAVMDISCSDLTFVCEYQSIRVWWS